MDDLVSEQDANGFAFNVKITLPAAMSATDGVYIGCKMVESLNVPVPEDFHRKLKYPEAVDEASVYVLPSQMVAIGPANA